MLIFWTIVVLLIPVALLLPGTLAPLVWLLLILLIPLSFFIPGVSLAPYVPMKKQDVSLMAAAGEPQQGEHLYELGSGDGRLLLELSRYSANITGIELSPLFVLVSRFRLWRAGVPATVRMADLKRVNFGEADVIYFFLMPRVLPMLQEKIIRECKPGCRIVSYCFPFPDWEPEHVEQKGVLAIRRYRVGKNSSEKK